MPDEYNKLPMNMRTYRAGLKKRQGKPTEKEPMKLEAGKNYEVSVEESPEKMQAEFIKHVKGECEIPMPKAEEIIPKEILKDMKITKPVNYGGYDVTAIRHESLGEFYRDVKYKTVDWRAPDGAEVILPAGMWFELADEIPRILAILGVGRCEQG